MSNVECTSNGDFDEIINSIVGDGKFQKRYNILFVFFLGCFLVPLHFNFYLILSTPNHNCKAPTTLHNISMDDWKNKYIPKIHNEQGELELSKCKMYSISENATSDEMDEVVCQFGWEFDKTWYTSTVITEEEWVCDRKWYVSNSMMASRIGIIFGTFIYGHLSDVIGRKPIFIYLMFTFIIGKFLLIFCSHYTYLFYIMMFIGSSPAITFYQLPIVVATESSIPEHRSGIMLMHGFGWSMGFCAMPLIMWIVRDWIYYMIISTSPCIVFLVLYRYSSPVESPRWLAMKGNIDECLHLLEKIAKINNTKLPENTSEILLKITNTSKNLDILSLFSNYRLARNTIILVIQTASTSYLYNMIALNINSISVNPFLNLLFQGIIEFPSYKIAEILTNNIGRKWINVLSFFCCFIICILIIFMLPSPEYDFMIFGTSILLKFCTAISYFVVQVLTVEIYPTCSRQTGFATLNFIENAFIILVPYVVQIASEYNYKALPYISMSLLALVSAICGISLPETVNKKLPDTLDDTVDFGADQNIWGKIIRKN